MKNKPLTHAEVKEIKKDAPFITRYPTRSERRERDSNRNLVRQQVEIKDKRGKVTGTKVVFHKKETNIPRQYLGIKKPAPQKRKAS